MSVLRYAVRGLLRRPGFAAVSIATLALGIGANAAIFSLIDAVLLRPLPYPEPERIVVPWEFNAEARERLGFGRLPASPADAYDFATRNRTFEAFAWMRSDLVNLTGPGDPERVGGVRVSEDFFRVLGVQPIVGRAFLPTDAGRGTVVLVAERVWRTRLGADPSVSGRQIALNGQAGTIVGVMPDWFRFPAAGELAERFGFASDPAIWSLDVATPEQRTNRGAKSRVLIGRLKAGISAKAAEDDLTAIASEIARDFPKQNSGTTVQVISLREQLAGRVRPALLVLFTAVGFVLLIACVNVANLSLVRAAARQRELCVRRALGAARFGLVGHLLAESLVLAMAAGALGMAVAWLGLRLLLTRLPASVPALARAGLDWRVLTFALLLSIVSGIAFGLVPAFQVTRYNLTDGLKEGGRGTVGGRRVQRTRHALVMLEVGVAVLLLIGTMLLVRAFLKLTGVDSGFTSDRVLTMEISLPLTAYRGAEPAVFFERLLTSIEALPGVEAAGVTSGLPLSGREFILQVYPEGQPRPAPGQEVVSDYRVVSPGYFQALRVPLVEGEGLPEQPVAGADALLVVNETLARTCWPGQSAIGRRVGLGIQKGVYRVVGVVGDTKYSALDSPARAQVYVHQRQDPNLQMALVVRTSVDPMSLAAAGRAAVFAIDPSQPVATVRPMDDVVAASVSTRRFAMLLVAAFAALAVTLSIVGLYAVVSYSVAERIQEMGVRLALGAQPANLLALVLSEGVKLVVAGIALGLGAAAVSTELLEAQLYGVTAHDPRTFVGVPIALFLAAMLGCLVPARRAMRVNPAVALKAE